MTCRADPASNIILIGYRACGKTSVGQLLADRLGWRFVDTDDEVEREAGRSICDIFAGDGEPAFRERETRVIARLTAGARQVVSVGGGAVLSADNRRRLQAAGRCIWLTAPAEVLYERIQSDPRSVTQRPALSDLGGLAEVASILNSRVPLYKSISSHTVDTHGKSVEAVVEAVLTAVGETAPPAEPE